MASSSPSAAAKQAFSKFVISAGDSDSESTTDYEKDDSSGSSSDEGDCGAGFVKCSSRSPRRSRDGGVRLLKPRERLLAIAMSQQLAHKRVLDDTLAGEPRYNQDVYEFLAFVQRELRGGRDLESSASAIRAARRFLVGGDSYATHVANMQRHQPDPEALVKAGYALENRRAVTMVSYVSPTLHFGDIKDRALRDLVDGHARIVVKMYGLERLWFDAVRLVDLATDVVISAVMSHLLVLRYDYVVSPHMAYTFDWFAAPEIAVTVNNRDYAPLVDIRAQQPAQYVVVERADETLRGLVRSGLAARTMRGILWQLLFTLEAAYDVAGYLHGDLHPTNIMVRSFYHEPGAVYAGRPWLYLRAHTHTQGPSQAVLGPQEHNDLFVEIIDNGRARAYCPVSPPGVALTGKPGERVLYGNSQYNNFGVYADERRLDRSWDLRCLFSALMMEYDVDRIAAESRNSAEAAANERLRDDLKELLVVGSNAIFLVVTAVQNEEAYLEEWWAEDAAVYAFFSGAKKLLRDVNVASIVGDRTFVPSHDLAVGVYDLLQPMFFTWDDTEFSEVLQELFSDMGHRSIHANSAVGVTASSLHRLLTPSLCLALPLFADLEAVSDVDALLVGAVTGKATTWIKGGLPDSVATQSVATAAFGQHSADAHAAAVPCAVCGRAALGYMTHSDGSERVATDHAFCGKLCMRIHHGDIVAARPH